MLSGRWKETVAEAAPKASGGKGERGEEREERREREKHFWVAAELRYSFSLSRICKCVEKRKKERSIVRHLLSFLSSSLIFPFLFAV